mgnify:CR=1 FL=1
MPIYKVTVTQDTRTRYCLYVEAPDEGEATSYVAGLPNLGDIRGAIFLEEDDMGGEVGGAEEAETAPEGARVLVAAWNGGIAVAPSPLEALPGGRGASGGQPPSPPISPRKAIVEVTQRIEVTIDEARFDQTFFDQFNASITDHGDDLGQHFRHLAVLHARGVADDDRFIEGYGPAQEMGIRFRVVDEWDELDETASAEANRPSAA